MGAKTNIEWTDASCSPIRASFIEIQNDGSGKERIGWHCTHVSEGCRNCYAESLNRRLGTGQDYKPGVLFREENIGRNNGAVKVFLDEKMLRAPMSWRRPRKIFMNSMTDMFGEFVKDDWIWKQWAMMALCPRHIFQIVTKRPERMRQMFTAPDASESEYLAWQTAVVDAIERMGVDEPEVLAAAERVLAGPLPNVWLGTSVEDQPTADKRIPELAATPAAVHFISAEPLLGPIDLEYPESLWPKGPPLCCSGHECGCQGQPTEPPLNYGLDWIIVGGESGPDARPMKPEWVRSLRSQSDAAGVSFFFKQWGAWAPQGISDRMMKVGKGAAGRILDGKTYGAFPGAAT